MAEKNDVATDDKKDINSMANFLEAPRRKRKNYVIMATGNTMDQDLVENLKVFVQKNFSTLAISQPYTPEELSRQFGRNISLLIINDQFGGLEQTIDLVKSLKTKRQKDNIPVLFLTKNQSELIQMYHEHLLVFNESDEYVDYRNTPVGDITARIRQGIQNQYRRKGRRYKVSVPLTFYHLEHDRTYQGELTDLSVYGAFLAAEDGCLFSLIDQLRVNLPTGGFTGFAEGEYLKLSAKVRRVFISGSFAAVSFEYLSENQINRLTRFLNVIVKKDMERNFRTISARYSADK